MIDIELKAKHYFLIADIMFSVISSEGFTTLEKIKTATTGATDDQLVTVSIEPDRFIYVFQILTVKPEGQYNMVNTEMMTLLTPQIEAGIAAGNTEWIYLATQIQTIRENNWTVVPASMVNGKTKLFA